MPCVIMMCSVVTVWNEGIANSDLDDLADQFVSLGQNVDTPCVGISFSLVGNECRYDEAGGKLG